LLEPDAVTIERALRDAIAESVEPFGELDIAAEAFFDEALFEFLADLRAAAWSG
jgi:hypothetical protein